MYVIQWLSGLGKLYQNALHGISHRKNSLCTFVIIVRAWWIVECNEGIGRKMKERSMRKTLVYQENVRQRGVLLVASI